MRIETEGHIIAMNPKQRDMNKSKKGAAEIAAPPLDHLRERAAAGEGKCPMCGGPVTTSHQMFGAQVGYCEVTTACGCPDAHFVIGDENLATDELKALAIKKHISDRRQFRDGFDAAMQVVHRFAETHLPTVEKAEAN